MGVRRFGLGRVPSALAFVTLIALASCGAPESAGQAATERMASDVTAVPADAAAVAGDTAEAASETPEKPKTEGAPTTTAPLLLAYSYSAVLQLPGANVTSTMKAHQQECIKAGPAVCQVVTASTRTVDDSNSADLELRAVPTWLTGFREGLEQDARAARGTLKAQATTSEDLTRSITDSEARLRAQKALRTRIEALIASRPAKLSDLLEAETELARVQGEIDSYESQLSVMRARVNMSTMEINYQSNDLALGGSTFAPLSEAVTSVFHVMSRSLAVLITLLAAVLPFVLVLGPSGFYFLKWRSNRRAAKAAIKPS